MKGGSKEAGRRLYFSAGARIVVAETAAPALFEPARFLFPAYEVPPSEQLQSDRVDVSVRRKSHGYVVASFDSSDVLCQTQMGAVVEFEFALSRSLAASLTKHVHLHASGAVVDGQAVLALGNSGAGKSSVAVSMLTKGYPTLGDDTVMLASDGRVSPFKRLLKVNPVVLRELGIDPTATVCWDPDWPEVWYDPQESCGWAAEAPVAIITLARYDPNAPLRLTPISAEEALNAVVHSVMTTGMPAGADFDRLIRLVRDARVFRLDFNSAVEAAEAICSLAR